MSDQGDSKLSSLPRTEPTFHHDVLTNNRIPAQHAEAGPSHSGKATASVRRTSPSEWMSLVPMEIWSM